MAQTVKIRLDGPGGLPMSEKILKTAYASGMDFEPDERRMQIASDGTVELVCTKSPYMVHVKMQVPLYGQLWVMADNLGEGYTGDFVDFVSEATRTYIAHAKRYGEGIELSVQTRGHLETLIGEEDQLMTVGEPFGLWVIEEKGELRKYIHPGHHNIDVVLAEDVTPYKKRKVRVLNGSHTNLVPAGLFLGQETVCDCMNDDRLLAFVQSTLDEEIIPFVPGSGQFAGEVLERFRNPYLNHQLTSIALNSISKWRARVLPSFRDYYAANRKIPTYLTIGFSYLMALYASVKHEGEYYVNLPTRRIQLMDDKVYLDYFANGGSIENFMKDVQIWNEDLTAYPGFCEKVAEQVAGILNGVCLL